MFFRNQLIDSSKGSISWLLLHELIKLHKGKVRYCSDNEKKSSIILTFPTVFKQKALGIRKVCKDKSSLSTVYEEMINREGVDKIEVKGGIKKGITEKIIREKPLVLLIEESEEMRILLNQILSEEYHVIVITDKDSMHEIICKKQPNIILSGSNFFGLSGEDICYRIKSDLKTAHIPFILFIDSIPLESANYRMADYYMILPLDFTQLKIEINSLIINRRIIRKRYLKLILGTGSGEFCDIEEILEEEDRAFITKARQLIEMNMSDSKYSIGMLCAEMHMSRTTFYNKLKMIAHQTPTNFKNSVRINRALILLMSKRHSVSEVAEMTGFNDTKYFREIFKKYYGEAPLKFVNAL